MAAVHRYVSVAKDFLTSKQDRVLSWLAVFTAVVFAAIYFLTAIPRIFYPYDLDFIEDGLLLTSLRLAHNQPIFVPPNADFVPHVYMPLYMWLGGLLFRVTGPSYVPLRLLSLAAIISISGLIYWIAQHESNSIWLGVVCAGLFLGGYQINGFWYELARVDAMFMALTLVSLTVAVYGAGSKQRLLWAALGLALAFFTKQTGFIVGIALTIYLLVIPGRRTGLFGLVFSLLTIIPVITLNALTRGWFLYYTFHIAAINPLDIRRFVNFGWYELLGLMGSLSLVTIVAGLLGLRRVGWRVIWDQPWFIWIGVAILISGMSRASVGGNLNDRLPAYTLLCLAPALLLREWNLWPHFFPHLRISLITVLILVQFVLGAYNPLHHLPTLTMHQSGDQLIKKLAAVDGEVLVLMHPYYAYLAGKTPSAQMAALWHARERGQLPLPPDFVARIEKQYYTLIISDNSLFESEPSFQQLLNQYYLPTEILGSNEAPVTNTGMIIRPTVVYTPLPTMADTRFRHMTYQPHASSRFSSHS